MYRFYTGMDAHAPFENEIVRRVIHLNGANNPVKPVIRSQPVSWATDKPSITSVLACDHRVIIPRKMPVF